MTEDEWVSCRDFDYILHYLHRSGRASRRKLRLFALALEWPEYLGWESDEEAVEHGWQSHILRCIFSNPFRPLSTIDSTWFTWNDGVAVKLAQTIYDGRRFEDMPILADALIDAGCTNNDILNHCRQPGVHVRGCWVLDLLLGKE